MVSEREGRWEMKERDRDRDRERNTYVLLPGDGEKYF